MEGYSLLVATRSVLQGAQAMSMSFWEYIRRGMDPTTVAVMMEDGAAVTGLLIAGVSSALDPLLLRGNKGIRRRQCVYLLAICLQQGHACSEVIL